MTDICRDCKQEKEIRDRGRCDECTKEYNNAKSNKHYAVHGNGVFHSKCIICEKEFDGSRSDAKLCPRCLSLYISPNKEYNKSVGGNNGYYYKDSIEEQLGKLPENVIPHHIDGDNTNNTFDNLALMHKSSHIEFHHFLKHMNVIHAIKNIPMTPQFKREYLKIFSEQTKTTVGVFYNDDGTVCTASTIRKMTRVYSDPSVFICDCGNTKDRKSNICLECSKKEKVKLSKCPTREILVYDMKTILNNVGKPNMLAIGRKYSVSDNTIRKWIIRLGIEL